VLSRVYEYLHIICIKLARVNGLIFEEYMPAAEPTGLWLPAPHSLVNYGGSCLLFVGGAPATCAPLSPSRSRQQQPANNLPCAT
jgi:hypothetical protein